MRAQTIFLRVMIGALFPLCSLAAPQAIRGGSITNIEVIGGEVEWVDLETVLLKERIEPRESVPEEARTIRAPDVGNEFIVLKVGVSPGSSIGRMDFQLRLEGGSYQCLAMAVDETTFDPRRLEVIAEAAVKSVRLLYEVPEGVEKASLHFSLATRLSVPDVQLAIQEAESEKTEAEDGVGAEDEDAQVEWGGVETETETEPSAPENNDEGGGAEPEPEPEPKPNKPKPKPDDEKDEAEAAWDGLL